MTRQLDFLVVGAQKAGTTSLWQYLRAHPRLHMPRSKELPLFTAPGLTHEQLRGAMGALCEEAPPEALVGKVTPDYMVGAPGLPVEAVAERIATVLPTAKLIAILRDPVERALSSYAMAVRRGQEERPAEIVLAELLEPERLRAARADPDPVNSHVVAGEYGRMLAAYRAGFKPDRLLVVFTAQLGDEPELVLDRVLAFLGLPPGFRPEGLEVRHFRGGTRKLLDEAAEKALFSFYETEIEPYLRGSQARHRRAFEFFFETWNVAAEDEPPSLSVAFRRKLQDHFARDAEQLGRLGIEAPWLARWD